MLANNGIRSSATTARNATGNAICERVHKTIGDHLRILIHEHPPQNIDEAHSFIDSCIASTNRALRTAVHRTLQVSPGSLVFHRDMLLPIPLLVDFELIRERRQVVIDDNNRCANLRRHSHDYQPGNKVLLIRDSGAKMESTTSGPYTIERVHTNGTVTILRNPGVVERVNIRRIKPFQDS